jgi:hypothetical protein
LGTAILAGEPPQVQQQAEAGMGGGRAPAARGRGKLLAAVTYPHIEFFRVKK